MCGHMLHHVDMNGMNGSAGLHLLMCENLLFVYDAIKSVNVPLEFLKNQLGYIASCHISFLL